MKKEELRIVPIKNYFILAIVILVSFLFVYYLYLWFDNYKETMLNMPILDKYMDMINYNELDDYLVENPDSIIYVSVLENSDIREFEKKIKNAYRKNDIDKKILYMNITDDIKNIGVDEYQIGDVSILNVPVIVVFDGGNLKQIYDIKADNYDINNFKKIIQDISFSSEDEIDG